MQAAVNLDEFALRFRRPARTDGCLPGFCASTDCTADEQRPMWHRPSLADRYPLVLTRASRAAGKLRDRTTSHQQELSLGLLHVGTPQEIIIRMRPESGQERGSG